MYTCMVLIYCLWRLPSDIRESECSQGKWVMASEGRTMPGVRDGGAGLSVPGCGRQKKQVTGSL